MTSWVEPLGFSRSSGSGGPDTFFETRRFVVVRSKPGHCLCLSVHTYGRQATTKPGAWADEHAAIIQQGGNQVLHPGEPELKKEPIQVKLESSSVIDAYSRIDFSRVYTVEYNIPVKNIGRVLPAYIETFEMYFSQTVNMTFQELDNQEKTDSLLTWLSSSPPYNRWSESGFSMLWITGTSHVGNSALAHWFASYQLPSMGRRIICAVSFRKGRTGRNNGTLALQSLLFQLLSHQPFLAKYLEYDFQTNVKDIVTSYAQLWRNFLAIVLQARERVTCVLDGLDEDFLGAERSEILDSLHEVYCSKVGPVPDLGLSIIVTSQRDPEINRRFHTFLCDSPFYNDWVMKLGNDSFGTSPTLHKLASQLITTSGELTGDSSTTPSGTPQTLDTSLDWRGDREHDVYMKRSSRQCVPASAFDGIVRCRGNDIKPLAEPDHLFDAYHNRFQTILHDGDEARPSLHRNKEESFPCEFPACDKKGKSAFSCTDELQDHLRRWHKFKI